MNYYWELIGAHALSINDAAKADASDAFDASTAGTDAAADATTDATADDTDADATGAISANTDIAGTADDTDVDAADANVDVTDDDATAADVIDAVDALVLLFVSPIFGFISYSNLSEKIRVNLCVGGGLFSLGFHFLPTTYFVLCVG